MDFIQWLQLTGICMVGAISPGPSLGLVINNTIDKGRSYGIVTGLGHAFGIACWAMFTAFGIAEVVVHISLISLAMRIFGVVLIAYIGFRTVFGNESLLVPKHCKKGIKGSLTRGAIEGLLVSLFNPKIALFFVAIFSHFVDPDSIRIEMIFMGLVAGLVDATWYASVTLALTGPKISGLIRKEELLLRRISGILLMLTAIYLVNLVFLDFV